MTSFPESINPHILPKIKGTRSDFTKLGAHSRLTRPWLLLCISLLSTHLSSPVWADDSAASAGAAAAPSFDMGALASLASNLGSNPQLMNMVSSFLGQNNQKPSAGQAQDADSLNQDANSLSLDSQSLSAAASAGEPPLRRAARPQSPQPQVQMPQPQAQQVAEPMKASASVAAATTSTAAAPTIQAAPATPVATATAVPANSGPSLSSLMSLLPSVLPNLNLASLGGLGSLLGGGRPSTAAAAASRGHPALRQEADQSASASVSASSGASSPSLNLQPAPAASAAVAASSASNPNPAQQVINQVLTAYASGQIPNDLIQMGLSGRVPSAIMELALSGQVPQQLIQMIITGQIPTATINTFLNAMQGNSGGSSPASATTGGGGSSATANAGASRSSSGSNTGIVGSTTRAIFEAIFRPRTGGNSSGTSITVPTLLGPLPIQIPAFPNVRKFGQMVGGTITNMASMIPF